MSATQCHIAEPQLKDTSTDREAKRLTIKVQIARISMHELINNSATNE